MNMLPFPITCLLLKALLDITYVLHISPSYSYAGLTSEAAPLWIILSGYVSTFILAKLCSKLPEAPSKMVYGLLLMITYIPTGTLTGFGGFNFFPFVVVTLGFFIFYLASRTSVPVFRRQVFTRKYSLSYCFQLCIYLFAMVWLILKYGVKLPTSLLNVYDDREMYKTSLQGESFPTAYLMSWLGGVTIPFMFSYSLAFKDYRSFLMVAVGLIEIFGIAGNKSFVFSLGIILLVFIGVKYFKNRLLSFISLAFSTCVTIAFAIDSCLSTPVVTGLFIRRMFFVPSQLYFYYYDYFSKNDFVLLANSILSPFFDYSYSLSVPDLIGSAYMKAENNTYANANIFADGYANFGITGVFAFCLILSLFLKVIDNAAESKKDLVVYPLLAMPCISLTNTALFTSLLTHGIIIALISILLLPRVQAATEGQSAI